MFDRCLAPSLHRTRRPQLRLESLESRAVPAAAIGAKFPGEIRTNRPWRLPDTVGSIGPNHYVQIVNGRFNVYNKTTGDNVRAMDDDTFWVAAGISTSITSVGVGDPRVHFDPLSGRWFAVEFSIVKFQNSIVSARFDPRAGFDIFAWRPSR